MIAVVDDDAGTCRSIQRLLHSHGFESLAYSSADAFLATAQISNIHCLILDVRMPGLSGPELQDYLLKSNILIPIIYVTGFVDEKTRAYQEMGGTVEILEKPFNEDVLLAHVKAVLKVFN